MLRSGMFGRTAGILGTAANATALGLYLPSIGVLIAVASVLFLEAWYVVVAWRLHRLDHGATRSH